MDKVVALYADGGVIGVNPSVTGGTYAWVAVDPEDHEVCYASGIVLPDPDWPTISNNLTELIAILEGLEALGPDWTGTVYSDSQVTLGRVFTGWARKNVPPWANDRLNAIIMQPAHRHRGYQLLQGHPTVADLERGIGAKRGLPVSKWNVRCDDLCQEAPRKLMEQLVNNKEAV